VREGKRKGNEKAIVQGKSQRQARVKWLAAIDQQVGVVEHAPPEAEVGVTRGSTALPVVLGQRPLIYTLAREARERQGNGCGTYEYKLNVINFLL
jgi:hypothetical protein